MANLGTGSQRAVIRQLDPVAMTERKALTPHRTNKASVLEYVSVAFLIACALLVFGCHEKELVTLPMEQEVDQKDSSKPAIGPFVVPTPEEIERSKHYFNLIDDAQKQISIFAANRIHEALLESCGRHGLRVKYCGSLARTELLGQQVHGITSEYITWTVENSDGYHYVFLISKEPLTGSISFRRLEIENKPVFLHLGPGSQLQSGEAFSIDDPADELGGMTIDELLSEISRTLSMELQFR